jgi:ABC-2 type transport system permease protein
MRRWLTLWLRELQACFLSPVAYVTMVVFLAMAGLTFLKAVEGNVGNDEQLQILFFVALFFWLPILITVITMRSFAEERRSGTLEMLMTAPVREAQIVGAKFAACLVFLLVVVSPALLALPLLRSLSPGIETLDWGGIQGGCLVVLLVSSLCVSIGMLASLLTRNQIVAAICCFAGVLLPIVAGYVLTASPVGPDRLVEFFSIETHILDFARGSGYAPRRALRVGNGAGALLLRASAGVAPVEVGTERRRNAMAGERSATRRNEGRA